MKFRTGGERVEDSFPAEQRLSGKPTATATGWGPKLIRWNCAPQVHKQQEPSPEVRNPGQDRSEVYNCGKENDWAIY